ncbi:TetR family transcriptional regulator [Streptomyces sp. NPDC057638]|uniref:TetR family transcriptional regulator n=1 Tax=Streptomyces sp. NPDC057638 TaxID=3346190 RepID=UPI00369DAAA7
MTDPRATPAPDGPREPAGGLRERKKQRTRDALVRAALELFIEQGYERTTVDEIAAAVEVSQRTFFRYFASKEEVAFAIQDLVEWHFVTSLRQRPADEGPVQAMRNAVLASWDTIGEAIGEIVPVETHIRGFLMIESTPALLAAHLRRSAEVEDSIARLVAEREGVDITADPRPRVLVAAFAGAMRVAGTLWAKGEDWSPERLRELTAWYVDGLVPALTDPWHP